MSIFKCKICGGTLEISAEQSTATCEYCGTQQTLPKLDSERRANLYDRANHFRRNNEFDKAISIYETILNEGASDAEAYWSLVLCRFGIEYVEDPATHKRVPIVNRAQFTSVFDDSNYLFALQYADESQRQLYQQEAKAINEIQKGILAISQREESFDVFICYKETDSNGRRTQDSVLANDLYHQLTAEGFKVFFSRITLEDKLGIAYEYYIFAALNSAKVMVVLGTKPEYFNAVWVKNEWSRYLSLVKASNGKKVLIPAYKGKDPYDLPDEFSHLQAQDMDKLGFMQDLIRGIKKLAAQAESKATVKETVIATPVANANITPLLKRAFMYLEDGEGQSADEYCERVLDQDPENAQAYLGKLMAEHMVSLQDNLRYLKQPFDNSTLYQKVMRFGDEQLKATMEGYIDHINTRNENERLQGIYDKVTIAMCNAKTEADYKAAAKLFETIKDYKDASALITQCYDKAEVARKVAVYSQANSQMVKCNKLGYQGAIRFFEAIPGWRDANEKAQACRAAIEEINAKEESQRLEVARQAEIARQEAERKARRNKKIGIIVGSAACVIIGFLILLNTVIIRHNKYKAATALYESRDYEAAISVFEELGSYKDSANAVLECKYGHAIALAGQKDYDTAISIMLELDGYKDSAEKAQSIRTEQLKQAKIGDTILFGSYEHDNEKGNGKEDIEWIILTREDNRLLVISKQALDCKPYNTKHTDVTWETCTLRQWLNSDFLMLLFPRMKRQ